MRTRGSGNIKSVYKNYIGIDPGKTGAICCIDIYEKCLYEKTPTLQTGKKKDYDISAMVELLENYINTCENSVLIMIEKVHAMPGQGVTSMFNFGMGYGIWQGIIAALKTPFEFVTPQKWKKVMMEGFPKEKSASILRVKQIYTKLGSLKKSDNGIADAILIARYGMNKYLLGNK